MIDDARPPRRIASRPWLGPALLGLFLFVLTAARFGRWMPPALFGDDLSNYEGFLHGDFASSPWQALSQSYAEKFRPVFALVMEALFSAFGPHLPFYLLFNVILNAISGLIMGRMAYDLSGRSRIIAVLAASMTAGSRFMLYQVTQLTGILEGLGYFLFLAMALALITLHLGKEELDTRRTMRLAELTVLAEWLLVFTHERYLAAVPWVCAMLWLSPAVTRLAKDRRRGLIGWAAAALAANLGYKILELNEAVLVGTGGTHIGFDLAGEFDRIGQAVSSVVGFNHGPDYLAGFDLLAHPWSFIGAAALALVAALCALLTLGITAAWPSSGPTTSNERWRHYVLPGSFAVLAGLILIPPVLTIRMEQRWLVEPFALMVLTAAWAAGMVVRRRANLALGLFTALALASLTVDIRIGRAFHNIFMVYSGKAAGKVKHDLAAPEVVRGGIVVIGGPDVCNWVLLNGEFFRFYAPRLPSAACVTANSQIDPASFRLNPRPEIYQVAPDYSLMDVSTKTYARLESLSQPRRYDFIKLFDTGQISDMSHADTPTGRGALLLQADDGNGQIETLTVLTGFSYRFDHLAVDSGDELKFSALMVYPTTQAARAVVQVVRADGSSATVYDAVLPIRAKDGPPIPVSARVPIGRYGPQISVVFSVRSTGADMSGQWGAFSSPRIVRAGP